MFIRSQILLVLCLQSRSWLHALVFLVMSDTFNMQAEELVMWLVVWTPLFLDPSDGVFGRFDLAALLRFAAATPTFLFFCL